uniref:Cysteine dioxygenase n=1 Tax=Esox lucius TaxID=8010 RepID=A0AAY5K6P6_ESOLU
MEQTDVMKPETLDDLIHVLHKIFESDNINVEEVQAIMEAYESNPQEWMRFAKFDQFRYTRNLVDEGNGKFNLIILCWGEGHGSSIHDHTNSHCFMKMLQGKLKETRFEWPNDKTRGDMVQTSEKILEDNMCAYINDSMGLHRVENPSHTEGSRTGHKNTVKMTFWSKFGERTPFVRNIIYLFIPKRVL